jgi:Spy/CpxP family protein refolding chaperone
MHISKKTLSTPRAAALLVLALIPTGLGAQEHQTPEREGHAGQQQEGPCMMAGKMQAGMMSGSMMDTGPMHGQMRGMTHDMGMVMGMVGGRATMQAMRLQPRHILSLREELDLTPEQVSTLEALGGAHYAKGQVAMAVMRAERQHLAELLEADRPDTAAVRGAARVLAERHGDMYVRALTTAAAVRGVLTPAQREKVSVMPCPMCGMDGAPGNAERSQRH